MKTVKIALITLTAVVSTNMLAMFAQKPQTAAGHASLGIRKLRSAVKGAYAQTMDQAYQGNGEILGLRSEVRGAVNDLKDMGTEVKGITDDVQGVADVGLELIEEELTKNGFFAKRPKLKRQINKIVAEARTALPYLLTTVVVAWLGYSYVKAQKEGTVGWYTWITDKVGGIAARNKAGEMLRLFGWNPQPVSAGVPVTITSVTGGTTTTFTTTALPGQPIPTVQNPGVLAKGAIWTERTVGNGLTWLKKSIWA